MRPCARSRSASARSPGCVRNGSLPQARFQILSALVSLYIGGSGYLCILQRISFFRRLGLDRSFTIPAGCCDVTNNCGRFRGGGASRLTDKRTGTQTQTMRLALPVVGSHARILSTRNKTTTASSTRTEGDRESTLKAFQRLALFLCVSVADAVVVSSSSRRSRCCGRRRGFRGPGGRSARARGPRAGRGRSCSTVRTPCGRPRRCGGG